MKILFKCDVDEYRQSYIIIIVDSSIVEGLSPEFLGVTWMRAMEFLLSTRRDFDRGVRRFNSSHPRYS